MGGGGGGVVERNQTSDIRHPKNLTCLMITKF